MMNSIFRHLIVALFFGVISPMLAQAADSKVYELRIYVTNEGKLDALLMRFRDHTCKLFAKHGIENIGYWTPIEEADGSKNTLLYIVAHQSREAAISSWQSFASDPEWKTVQKDSEVAGKILAKAPESIFMTTTKFSPPLKITTSDTPRVFEMRTYTTAPGKLESLHQRFKTHTISLFTKHGMSHLAYWTPLDAGKGANSKLIYILSHPSQEAGLAAFQAFRKDPLWLTAKADSEKNGSLILPLPNGVKSIYLKAANFSPIR